MSIILIISLGCSRHDHKAFEIQMMNLDWPWTTRPTWPAAASTVDSWDSAISGSIFSLRVLWTRGYLRLIREGNSKVFLLLQVEVRGHEVKQLLGQKLGLEREQNGRVSDKTFRFPKHTISISYFLKGMSHSSRTSIHMVFIKPKELTVRTGPSVDWDLLPCFPVVCSINKCYLPTDKAVRAHSSPPPHRRTFYTELTRRYLIKKKKNIYIYKKVNVKSLSDVRLFATPWTAAYQAPPSMGFSRQEYWSGLPFPSPGDLPNPGM